MNSPWRQKARTLNKPIGEKGTKLNSPMARYKIEKAVNSNAKIKYLAIDFNPPR